MVVPLRRRQLRPRRSVGRTLGIARPFGSGLLGEVLNGGAARDIRHKGASGKGKLFLNFGGKMETFLVNYVADSAGSFPPNS